nr:hypothetical protein [Sinorhizobium medicae]
MSSRGVWDTQAVALTGCLLHEVNGAACEDDRADLLVDQTLGDEDTDDRLPRSGVEEDGVVFLGSILMPPLQRFRLTLPKVVGCVTEIRRLGENLDRIGRRGIGLGPRQLVEVDHGESSVTANISVHYCAWKSLVLPLHNFQM